MSMDTWIFFMEMKLYLIKLENRNKTPYYLNLHNKPREMWRSQVCSKSTKLYLEKKNLKEYVQK